MDLLDRLLGHDAWTTRQLLLACAGLPDAQLDQPLASDQGCLRQTFVHLIENMELWTDLMAERPLQGQERMGQSIPELLTRLGAVSRDFAYLARQVARQNRYDDCFVDVLDNPPRLKTFGGGIGHVLTHNMHHRAQIMALMEAVGLQEHIEGDLLSWESQTFGWR